MFLIVFLLNLYASSLITYPLIFLYYTEYFNNVEYAQKQQHFQLKKEYIVIFVIKIVPNHHFM